MNTEDDTKKGAAGKAGAKSAGGVQLSCKVLEGGLLVAGFKKGRGAVIPLPEAEATALEKLGKVKILGPVL